MTLKGASRLKSGDLRAGMGVPSDASLTVTEASTGSLMAIGGSKSAGFGGNGSNISLANLDGVNITISGGAFTATGGKTITDRLGGAGIGGGGSYNGLQRYIRLSLKPSPS